MSIQPNEPHLYEIAAFLGFTPTGNDLQAKINSLATKLGISAVPPRSPRRVLLDCRGAAGMGGGDLGGVDGSGYPDSGC